MSQESIGHGVSSRISRGIASTYELDSFELDELFITRPPESVVLSDLSEESYNNLSSIFVWLGEINLVAEDDKPLV